jgi:RNA polymerase sigma-70 factor, ECF subfamily
LVRPVFEKISLSFSCGAVHNRIFHPNGGLNMDQTPPISPEETESLLEQIASGLAALNHLLERYRPILRLPVDGKLGARFDASDVAQEAEFEIFQRIQEFLERRPMSFDAWVRVTAKQAWRRLYRTHVDTIMRSIRREVELPDESCVTLGEQLLGSGSSPSERIRREELATQLRDAIAQLEQTDGQVIAMRYYMDLSNGEVAQILDIDMGEAQKRHGGALRRLRKILKSGLTESQL